MLAERTSRSVWTAAIQDPKSGMILSLSAPTPFTAYALDEDSAWGGPGKRPDGVVITSEAVCFVELKGRIDRGAVDRPFEQLLSGARHFCPSSTDPDVGSHGDAHHERFREGHDLPIAPRERTLALARTHAVCGAVVVSRGGTRHLPRETVLAEKRLRMVVIQRHGIAGRTTMTIGELIDQAVPTGVS